MFIYHNPFLEDEQVMVEQDEGMINAENWDNNNNSEEEVNEVKEEVGIEFIERKKFILKMLLNLYGLIYEENMRNTLLRLTWLRVYKASWWRNFPKRVTGGLFNYFSNVPKED